MSDNRNFFLLIKEAGGTTLAELKKTSYSIGRSPNSDICLISKGVSRHHATIYYSKQNFWIVDGDLQGSVSTNGLFVNKQKVSVHRLKPHDVITFHASASALFINRLELLKSSELFEEFTRQIVYFVSGKGSKESAVADFSTSTDSLQGTLSSTTQNPFLDDLTRLPNRSYFFTRVKRSIEFRLQVLEDYNFAVLFIDVDRFKIINDSLGHLVGDQLLIQIAERLSSCLREGDMVARLGGDEFAILLDALRSPDEAIFIARRLQQSLVKPLTIDTHEIYPSLSIGIALSTWGYETVEAIIRDADTAMYHAKTTGKSKFVVFDEEMHQKATEMFHLDSALRKAIQREELQLYYQPIVSLSERRLVGFEALIRWHHPSLGSISPTTFIPLSEENNLIYQIGYWVLEEACRQLSLWKENPRITLPLTMNVNLSSKQLSESYLVERLLSITGQNNVTPNELKLEVTESILMEGIEHSIKIFHQLKEFGFQLAIDDFGTGYSSLSYLAKFPIDTLKIDRSFVSCLDKDDEITSINVTNLIIRLAHSLGVGVVAEGVENLYHLTWLKQQKCDYGQGFLFSKPLPADEATALAEQGIHWRWKF